MFCPLELIFDYTDGVDPVFMFCALGLIFGGTEGLRSRFSNFARPDSFSAVPRASGPVFIFCALGLVFGRV
jgi:hypothetical protein